MRHDEGVVSEDESSVSSYQAHLDLNGQVRLKKKGIVFLTKCMSTLVASQFLKRIFSFYATFLCMHAYLLFCFDFSPSDSKPSTTDDSHHNQTLLKPNFVIPQIKFEEEDPPENSSSSYPPDDSSFLSITSSNNYQYDSNDDRDNTLDDYIEDFILPMSHESVMSRQLSFRRKVQHTYDKIAADKASQELDKFDNMLSTYDEEDENNRSLTPDLKNTTHYQKVKAPSPPIPKNRSNNSNTNNNNHPDRQLRPNFNLQQPEQSLLDIDAIVKENAPNLMGSHNNARKGSDFSISSSETLSNGATPPTGSDQLESLSNYFLPQQTIDKLYAVYESSNFNNIYCLSGEIKNILSPAEIEEILENKDHPSIRFIEPNVMAALSLSWSLNPASLPPSSLLVTNNNAATPKPKESNKKNSDNNDEEISGEGLKSKSSSMSNGFHSDASDDNDSTTSSSGINTSSGGGSKKSSSSVNSSSRDFDDDSHPGSHGGSESGIESPSPTAQLQPQSSSLLQRGTPLTNSMRRRIAVSKGVRNPQEDQEQENNDDNDILNDMDEIDLGVGDEDWEDDQNDGNSNNRPTSKASNNSTRDNGTCLLRRDSKRFSFKGKDGQPIDRVVEGLFVESMNSNPKGTLRKIKAPLNLTADNYNDELEMSSPSPEPPTSLVAKVDSTSNYLEGIFILLILFFFCCACKCLMFVIVAPFFLS